MSDSILEQIIDSQNQSVYEQFDVSVLLAELLQLLDERERQVLDMRYGFSADKKRTLEDIGKQFSITRERVRQIEAGAVNKIKNSDAFAEREKTLISLIEQILDKVGGIIAEERLIGHLEAVSRNQTSRSVIEFLLHKLLHQNFSQVKQNDKMLKSWSHSSASLDRHEKVLDEVALILDEVNEIIKLSDLHERLHARDIMNEAGVSEEVLEHMLHTSAQLKRNPFDQWGRREWPLITPKRMNDKIYLVLKHHNEPIHFTEIADKINETQFDHKKAHPATVHNELILDNDRYVLIGRGIYALKEWGYKAGVVTDIIKDILQEQGPLAKDDIIEAVLKQRMVKKSTIVLMLTNKKLFQKLPDGRYDVVTTQPETQRA